MGAFEIAPDGTWTRLGEGAAQQPCSNYVPAAVCNWMVAAGSDQPLCLCCRTTQIVPALSKPENVTYWANLEQAKRRLFYNLLSLGLPVHDKISDPQGGVSFQFLEEMSPAQKVLTGHDDGVITLNIAEADDAQREKVRAQMHEPYRTLLGHFRHEIGHYYWDRLIANSPHIDRFRELFGDERADYSAALQAHYASPRADWATQFVSAYASSHPWEDWAECWAHYMHLHDGLETAVAWGVQLHQAAPGAAPVLPDELQPEEDSIEHALIENWLPLAQFVNAMSRSLGLRDGYPFVVSAPVIEKMNFIQHVVADAVKQRQADNPQAAADAVPETSAAQTTQQEEAAPAPAAVA